MESCVTEQLNPYICISKQRGVRAVEGARLESVYTPKAYRGFESLPLCKKQKSVMVNGALLFFNMDENPKRGFEPTTVRRSSRVCVAASNPFPSAKQRMPQIGAFLFSAV